MLRQSYHIDFIVNMTLMKLSVLWLHILFRPGVYVYRALCRMELLQFHSAQCTIFCELPDDDLSKPKHVGAITEVLKFFNNSTILE